LYRHAIAITPAGPLGALRSLPQRRRPSPCCRWVGSRITLFKACSAFTARYGLPTRQVTIMTFYTKGFDCFVTSAATPIATGWSDSCRVGISPTEEPRLRTAHCNRGLTKPVAPKQVSAGEWRTTPSRIGPALAGDVITWPMPKTLASVGRVSCKVAYSDTAFYGWAVGDRDATALPLPCNLPPPDTSHCYFNNEILP